MASAQSVEPFTVDIQEGVFATTSECIAHGISVIYFSTYDCVEEKFRGSVEYNACLQIAAEKTLQTVNTCETKDERHHLRAKLSMNSSLCIANRIPNLYNIMKRCNEKGSRIERDREKGLQMDCDLFAEEVIKKVIYTCLGMVLA